MKIEKCHTFCHLHGNIIYYCVEENLLLFVAIQNYQYSVQNHSSIIYIPLNTQLLTMSKIVGLKRLLTILFSSKIKKKWIEYNFNKKPNHYDMGTCLTTLSFHNVAKQSDDSHFETLQSNNNFFTFVFYKWEKWTIFQQKNQHKKSQIKIKVELK